MAEKETVVAHLQLSEALRRRLRFKPLVVRTGVWFIVFPDCGWWAHDCAEVREAIAAWYESGMSGLSKLVFKTPRGGRR